MAKFSDRLLKFFIERESKIGIQISKFLGADLNAQNEYGKTALDIAHFNRQTEVESLLKSAEQQNSD